MNNNIKVGLLYIVLTAAGYLFASAYMSSKRNRFPVSRRTVLITGGSQGLGRAAGTLLASKGANVVVVARNEARLKETVAMMQKAAYNAQVQRFTHVVADLSDANEASNALAKATQWNNGKAPDIVWCCAGTSTPTLFVDTDPATLKDQMDSNYFTAAFTAHAVIRAWVRGDAAAAAASSQTAAPSKTKIEGGEDEKEKKDLRPRHLVFTSSIVALFPVAGYAPYTATKSAMRGLADTLSMELQLYAGAHPDAPPITMHTVYPATIYSEGFEHEQTIKTDMCKHLEEGDEGQTPEQVAAAALRGLERGEENVPTSLIVRAANASVLGGARNVRLLDRVLSAIVASVGVMAFVRRDLDKKTREFGRKHGPSGMKKKEVAS